MQQVLQQARGVSLRHLFPQSRFFGGEDIRVSTCCNDSRRCKPGDLFVAVTGADTDGHDHVLEAIDRGAAGVLAERFLPIDAPTCIVDDTRIAFGQLCQRLAGCPSDHLSVIGVTGSSGKTVTSMLIGAILESANCRVGITSTIAHSDSERITPAQQTTPEPTQLANLMSRMVANDCTHAVLEASSRALSQYRMAGVEFDAAVLTNVRREHLDFHGSVINYRNAKARLFEQLKPGGFAVLNADDPGSQYFLSKLSCPTLTFGMRNEAEITASLLERTSSEQTFLVTAGNETVPVRTRIVGDPHIYNCLAATSVGLVLGLDLPQVVRGLESVQRVPGRMDRIECGQAFNVFVDYAQTPDTLAIALHTLRQVTRGRLICVFGAKGEQHRDQRALFGKVVEKSADLGVITNDNPRQEAPLEIAHGILDGFDRPSRAHILPDRAEAIRWALGQAKPGDTVLIAGKGHEDFQVCGKKFYAFDDAQVARDWLYGHADRT